MHPFHSIRTKLLIYVSSIFIISSISIFFITESALKRIIDKSYYELYMERIDSIINVLERTDKKLQNTGIPEAYIHDFQKTVIEHLKDSQYNNIKSKFPTIVDRKYRPIMHPTLPIDYKYSPYMRSIIDKGFNMKEGQIIFDIGGVKKWACFKTFDKWGWVVAYVIPLSNKYAGLKTYRSIFVCTLIVIGIISIILLYVGTSRFTAPITSLTKATSAMLDGKLDYPIDIKSSDEVGVLANSFESMRASIKDKIQDLTEVNRETESLKNYLNNVIDSMPSLIAGIDENGIITQWNKQAEQFTNVDKQSAIGASLVDVLPLYDGKFDKINDVISKNKPFIEQNISWEHDSQVKYYDLMVYPLTTESSSGAVVRLDDVTDQVHLEKMMIQTEKMTSVGGLAAGMAHEINNPLAAITQGVQNTFRRISPELPSNIVTAKRLGLDIEIMNSYLEERCVLKFLNGAKDAADRAAAIVKNMLKFSRRSDAQLLKTDMRDLMEEAITLGCSDYDMKKKYDFKFIEIVRDYADNLPLVMCCPGEIEQVLLNLFKNAIQAMELVEGDYKPRLNITLAKEANYVRIEVQDNGPGIPKEVQSRIFEPFFTTKQVGKGTGLGLSVSYMIITQNHNGTFQVSSEVGVGTTFIIRLPVG